MPRRPQRNRLRGHAADVVEAVFTNAVNPFAQFQRLVQKPSPTKTITSTTDIPESWKRKRDDWTTPEKKRKVDSPVMSPNMEKVIKKSLPILTSQAHMSGSGSGKMDGDGSGKEPGLKETPIDDPFNIQRGPPDYTFATLPYIHDNVNSSQLWTQTHTFRMTSPYDCQQTRFVTDLNTGSGTAQATYPGADSTDTVYSPARWFNLYASMYKYYHVIATRWHLTFENQSTQPLWVHYFYQNDVDRPQTATNADMLLWKDCHSHYVGPVAHAIMAGGYTERNDIATGDNEESANQFGQLANYETQNHVVSRGASNVLQISGEYRTGDFDREIRTDNLVENWTLCTTNPALPEKLQFRIRPQGDSININNTANYSSLLTYRFMLRIEYLVEFKELKDGLKYPISSQPATYSIVTST